MVGMGPKGGQHRFRQLEDLEDPGDPGMVLFEGPGQGADTLESLMRHHQAVAPSSFPGRLLTHSVQVGLPVAGRHRSLARKPGRRLAADQLPPSAPVDHEVRVDENHVGWLVTGLLHLIVPEQVARSMTGRAERQLLVEAGSGKGPFPLCQSEPNRCASMGKPLRSSPWTLFILCFLWISSVLVSGCAAVEGRIAVLGAKKDSYTFDLSSQASQAGILVLRCRPPSQQVGVDHYEFFVDAKGPYAVSKYSDSEIILNPGDHALKVVAVTTEDFRRFQKIGKEFGRAPTEKFKIVANGRLVLEYLGPYWNWSRGKLLKRR